MPIYAVFLCMVYAAHPQQYVNCNQVGSQFQSASECHVYLERFQKAMPYKRNEGADHWFESKCFMKTVPAWQPEQ
jgi:hypothetical protein